MAHNPPLNQQHSVMNSVAVSNQRGLATSKPMYSIQSSNLSQLSHLHQQQQQQSQMMGGYSTQKPSDVSTRQYSPSITGMNGNAYQSMAGSSLHSSLNMDQLNIHQHGETSPPHQFNQPQHHQYHSTLQQQPHQPQQQHYQANSLNQQHQQQSLSQMQSQKQPMSQHLYQSSSQFTMHQGSQAQQQVSQHSPVKPIQQQHHSQQHRQPPYVHSIQQSQRSIMHQQSQPKYDKVQPRRILQNTNSLSQRANQQRVFSKEQTIKHETKEIDETVPECAGNSTTGSDGNDDAKENVAEEQKIGEEITDNLGSASENKELANTKEKTPMTLIQELAKFNKIDRKYTLLDEQGPAHKKTFYVKLLLGTEEYSSSGASIRKAQQSAAAVALKETNFKHPPEKPAWRAKKDLTLTKDGKLTPTVELNGLAMKRGENASYKSIEPQQPPYYYPPGMDPRTLYNQRYYHYMRANRDPRYTRGYWPMRYHYPRMNRAFYVSLRVGHREFIGDGPTRQAARHNAAIKALKVLRNLPEKELKEEEEPEPVQEVVEEEIVDDADGLKSRVTSVHEIAFRRKLTVSFDVIRESGPPHMKTFITRCTVGDMTSEGEGNSKKLSKKIAAEQMFEKLKDLGPLPPSAISSKPKSQIHKKKNRIKAEIQQQKADPNYGVGINPISRLIQIMCAQKKKEPIYNLVTERGVSCRKEFIMQIEVEGKTCTGAGPNKKLAKRAAAEAMLELLGYNKPSPQPAKSSIKQPSVEGNNGNGEKKVTFSENCHKDPKAFGSNVSGHQQKVPGLLHLPSKTHVSVPVTSPAYNPKESLVNLSTILKPNWRPELQLRELCKAMNYPLEFDDFSKNQPNNTVEYVTRISVGPSESIQTFLGTSGTLESARDIACMDALKLLVSRAKDMNPAGDGSPHMKKSVLSRSSPGLRDVSQ